MARKKVKLALIPNDSARRATFKKRKKGLLKKVSELSILCGVSACAIIYGPYDNEQPDVWPSNPSDAHRVLTRFKSLPQMEQSKKMMNQEGLLGVRINKLKEQVYRQQQENRVYEITQLMYRCLEGKAGLHDVGTQDLSDLAWFIDEKMKAIQERMEMLRKKLTPQFDNQRMMKSTTTTTTTVDQEVDKMTTLEVDMDALQRQPWFMEVMNPHEHMGGCVGDHEMMVSYGDHNVTSWSNAFFP